MGIILRISGLIAIGLSMLAGLGLEHLAAAGGRHHPNALEFLLAALSFACASAGAALLLCGPKLLERQPVSFRWRRNQ